MTFLQPEALFGILALGLPLALFFFRQRRGATLPWAAVKILRKARERVPARSGKGERNLVFLRCLIVLLLCIVFARPVLDFSGTQTRMASGPARAVFVLDDSGSMMFRKGAQSSFEEAVESTSRLIRNLKPGSEGALIAGSGLPPGGVFKFEQDFQQLRKKLEMVRPSEMGTDLLPGIRAAINLLVKQGGGAGEIFVITDNQTLAWKKIGDVRALLEQNRDILFQVVGVGDSPANNLAITELVLDRGIPTAGKPIGTRVKVSNFGAEAVENVRVILRADNLPVSDQAMIAKLDPGKSATLRLFAPLEGAGSHSLTAGIPPDSLSYDNQRSLVLNTRKQMNVLIVEGTSVPIATDRDGYFLNHALRPVTGEQKKDFYLLTDVISTPELERKALKGYQMVILSNVSKLSPVSAQALSAFVGAGGGLVIFPGPNTDLLYYNTDRIFGPLLPAKLETPQNAPADQKFISLQKGPFPHPMMDVWDESPQSLAQVQYRSFFPLTLPQGAEKEETEVVLAFSDGRAAVVEKKKGDGRVILFNSTATPRWNNLPLHPAFIPLIHGMAGYLAEQKDGGLVLATGQPYVRNLGPEFAGKDFTVQGPRESFQGKVEANGNSSLLAFGDTGQAGVYAVFVGNTGRPEFMFAVQPDPLESDLRRMPQMELNALKLRSGTMSGTRLVTHQKAGHELWMELGLLIMALAMAEVFLTYRLNRRLPAS